MQKRIVRRNVAFGLMFVMLCSIIPFAFAEGELDTVEADITEAEDEFDTIEAGTTPDSALYGLDKAFDNLRYQMSSDKETTGLLIAQERLEELKVMSEEGKTEELEEAKQAHEEMVARVKARVEARLEEGEDEDALADSVRVSRLLQVQEAEIQDLKERLGDLTPAQRQEVLAFLLGSENALHRIRAELEDKESGSLIKFERKLGQSELEIRDKLYRLREDKRLKAEVFDNQSLVMVEYKFKQRSENGENISIRSLLEKTLNNVRTTQEEAAANTKIESGSDDDEDLVEEVEMEMERDATIATASVIAPITGKASGSGSDGSDDSSDDSSGSDSSVDDASDSDDDDSSDDSSVDVDDDDDDSVESEMDDDDDDDDSSDDSSMDVDEDEDNDGLEDELEVEDGVGSERLRLRIDLKRKDDGRVEAEVHFRMRFASGITPEEIYASIAEETNALTLDQLHAAARIKEENRLEEHERRVDVHVFTVEGTQYAEVRVEWDGLKEGFRIEAADREAIIAEIAARLGATPEEVAAALKRYEKKIGERKDVEEYKEELSRLAEEERKMLAEEEEDRVREQERLAEEEAKRLAEEEEDRVREQERLAEEEAKRLEDAAKDAEDSTTN